MADNNQLRESVLCNLQYEGAPKFIRRVSPRGAITAKAEWACRCGKLFVAIIGNVSSGHTRSCGCWHKERSGPAVRHGHCHSSNGKRSPTYKSWQAMLARCANPNHPAYSQYGGNGIVVCDRWRNSFDAFLSDMGERPEGLTLDRKDSKGHYEPDNCRWATKKVQTRNRAKTVFIDFEGESIPLVEAWERLGREQPYNLVFKRIGRGWDVHRACTTPSTRHN